MPEKAASWTVSYGAKVRAYGRYEWVTFGTNKQGWNIRRLLLRHDHGKTSRPGSVSRSDSQNPGRAARSGRVLDARLCDDENGGSIDQGRSNK
jgi:hypothetical protein